MKRSLYVVLVGVVLQLSAAWVVEAAPTTIENFTVGDYLGWPEMYRKGVIFGEFSALSESAACPPFVTAATLDAALNAQSQDKAQRLADAVLSRMVDMGCRARTTKPNV